MVLAASSALLAAAGCGESFVSSTGSGGSAGTGGTGTAGSAGSPACKDGDTQRCYDGDEANAGKGLCVYGEQKCKGGAWEACVGGDTLPAPETCDGKDSDCDGTQNNGCSCKPEETKLCFPYGNGAIPGMGPCKNGLQTCDDGVLSSCKGAVGPGTENCANMGTDDDCNGAPDDIMGFGKPCNTPVPGICQQGHFHCEVGPGLVCKADNMPKKEQCNGADDDCDGTADNVKGSCQMSVGVQTCSGLAGCMGNSDTCTTISLYKHDFSVKNADWETGGQWQIGMAQEGGGNDAGHPDPSEDHTGSDDDMLAGVVIGGDVSLQNIAMQYLTSPTIDLTQTVANTAHLSFYRWLNSDAQPFMFDTVEVSKDAGNSWVVLWSNDLTAIYDDDWVGRSHNVTSYMTTKFRVRFGVKVMGSMLSVSSWNIDDIEIASCPPN